MKRIKNISLLISIAFLLSSCNEWLQVDPQNEQLSYKYWSSQEDVEAVVNSGYYILR
ncbi:MAG: RagB/SusD family nutrient uptake outer membrane protein, partial [Bacteroidales bacterium]|nr:RagB/SusD family nutrient uptake outer membrane protein [Bacteroidales bacterium]